MTALHPRMNIRIWHLPNSNGELTNAGALIADESPVRHSRVFCTRWNGLTKAPGLMDGTMVQNLDVLNVPSRRRNPVIADIFNRLRYMDRRGSGFKKIVEDYQMYANVSNGAKPVFKSELNSFFITLPNLQYVVKGQDGTKAFEAILSHISNDPRITIDELVTLTGISRRQVLRYVKELTEDEVIRRDGGRKLGKWVILKEYSTKDSE